MSTRQITIPYAPRPQFKTFHDRSQRWACLVVHRRAGKTVSGINDLIRAAITCRLESPHFAYIAPYRSQAKSVAWDYLKRYAAPIMESANEAELKVTLLNGGRISLFGADNADAMRGLYFDGVFLDEFGDYRPSVWGNVIRPTLSDRQGWAVFSGTPKGKNQFWLIYEQARKDKDWFLLTLPASQSGLLPQEELNAAKAQLSDDQYEQEYECSFEAAIIGAIWGKQMREALERGRIRNVPHDPNLNVYTAWDIGRSDATAVWFWQVVGSEIHVIDFYMDYGMIAPDVGEILASKPYRYGKHYLPHDARAKTFATGKSTIEMLAPHLELAKMAIVPDIGVQAGIAYARQLIDHCYFDDNKCERGIEALRQYQHEYDEDKKVFRKSPLHNWASDPSDAFRMLAVAWRQEPTVKPPDPFRPLIVGPENQFTMNDAWSMVKSTPNRRI